ncbi:MAG: MoaD/ThiS family protein [Desulfurococcaceae archaeon]
MNSIRVKLRFLSPYFRDLAGINEEDISLENGSTMRDLLKKLLDIHGERLYEQLFDEETNDFRSGVLVVINNRVTQRADEKLKDGDIVVITMMYEGGCSSLEIQEV